MPTPDSDGKGGPNSNIANVLATAGAVTGEAANQGSEHGIIIVSGHDAVGSFWDQAAGAAPGGSTASVIATSAVSQAEIAGLTQAASTAPGAATAHDYSSVPDISAHSAALAQGVVAHDTGLAGSSMHAELGTMALHDVLGSAAFAHQMHV
jgi:hypothetical protein